MRRWLFFFWLMLLVIPAAGLFGPLEPSSPREARMLTQPPALPRTLDQALSLPRAVDAFIRDQFGQRDRLVSYNGNIRDRLNDDAGLDQRVVRGGDNYLLLREGLAQSVGLETSPARAARTGAIFCEMQRQLAASNIRVIFAVAPSPATIHPDIAPDWLAAPRTPTDYDLLLAATRGCGANMVDLRAPMRAYHRRLYRRTDTHWTPRGALIAYDEIVTALQEPQWRIEPEAVAWSTQLRLGDLTRMKDANDTTQEPVEEPDIAPLNTLTPRETEFPTGGDFHASPAFNRDYEREGARILLIGDSFGRLYFPDFFALFVQRMSFVHFQNCAFDWRDIERAAPDIVVMMPTERYALCGDDSAPANFEMP